MQERRSFPRTGLELPVHLTVIPADTADPQATSSFDCITQDMSRGGCAVIADRDIGMHTRCLARFPLATGRVDPDTTWAEVRRIEQQSGRVLLGLEFDTPLENLRIAPATDPTEHGRSGSTKVLVVDDQEGMRGLLSRYLGERGFDVRTAIDGEEAFRALGRELPDVLLLDLYLPRLNGYDLLRRMRDLGISVELIFTMSGYAETTDAQECLRLGAADHLVKPIDVEQLYRNILLRLGTRATA